MADQTRCPKCSSIYRRSNLARHLKQCSRGNSAFVHKKPTSPSVSSIISRVRHVLGDDDSALIKKLEVLKDGLTSVSGAEQEFDVWQQHFRCTPRLYPALECLPFEATPAHATMLHLITNIDKARGYNRRGQKADPRIAIVHLIEPSVLDPIRATDITLEPGSHYQPHYPATLTADRPPCDGLDVVGNITPLGMVTDLHADGFRDRLILCRGSVVKVVLMWPGTAENLRLMRELPPGTSRYLSVASKLHGGMIGYIDSQVALFFPLLTIHMTITLAGGVSFELNSITTQNISAALRNVVCEPEVDPSADWVNLLTYLRRQIQAATASQNPLDKHILLTEWAQLHPKVLKWEESNSRDEDWARLIHDIRRIIRAAASQATEMLSVPNCCIDCPNDRPQSFYSHYTTAHVDPPKTQPATRERSAFMTSNKRRRIALEED